MWQQNFDKSNIEFKEPENEKETKSGNYRKRSGSFDGQEEIVFKGRGPFSISVTKAFDHNAFSMTFSLQVPRFKIIKFANGEQVACFLTVVSLNGVTFGFWKRHSDFNTLASKLAENAKEFNNSLLSWQCLMNKKQWFRCLDKDYLALKCFLIERFMHDVLFESQEPNLLLNFFNLQ